MTVSDSRRSSSSAETSADEELRLPRPPGVIRAFWARHPLFADVLIALFCLLTALGANVTTAETTRQISVPEGVLVGVVILIASGLLLRRRRNPEIAMAAAIVVELLVLVFLGSAGSPLLPFALYAVAVYASVRACWIGLGVGVGLVAALTLILRFAGALTVQDAVNSILAVAIPGLIAALIGINLGNRKRYVEAIISRSRQLLVERNQQAQLAAAAERERIAREMHDIVSHSLTVVVALSEGAMATDDPERAREASAAAAGTARGALAEMRSMLGVLRSTDENTPFAPMEPVSPAATVKSAQQAGFAVSLSVRGEATHDVAVRFAIGRIVQEGVTNAIRHAPMASAIDVRIDYDADPIIIEIVNDGAPEKALEGGFGLQGLAERAALLGGILVSAPAGVGKWMLRAQLPQPTSRATDSRSLPTVEGDA